MTDKLPPPLLALFQPRPPLRYLPPSDRAPEDKPKSTLSGVAQYLGELKNYGEEVPYNATESWLQRKWRQKSEKKQNFEKGLTEGLHDCAAVYWFLIFRPFADSVSVQLIRLVIPRLEGTRSRPFLWPGSVTRPKSPISSGSLVATGPLRG